MTKEVKNIEHLIEKIRSYNPSADTELVRRAYFYSSEAHQRQTRKEGTPYIEHPLAVASVLADLRMDATTIAAGLLHDTVEDTDVITEDIRKRFGHDTAFLVEALTKLSRMEYKSKEVAQAESFRKMLLSMAEDIRVIIIKFADRLHNMRTLEFLPEQKKQRIAQETLDIYAPLANRLGIGWLKVEFEDLSFKHLMPQLYEELARKVQKEREENEGYIEELAAIVSAHLKKEDIPASVKGRVKHYYGIYQKMLRQKVPFEQIYDVLGIRIVTDTKTNCYSILGLIHSLWSPVPGKFKDYIGGPKSNQYQSLHTTIIGPRGERVEMQIRTDEMDRIAEEGIAAHWRYKEKGGFNEKDERYISWLRDLVSGVQTEAADAREFLEVVKAEVVPHDVYVFTPNGDVKELPYGSTPVDFAYSVHTQVGNKCVGAKVNGRLVPLKHKLQSGDTVEIVTSPNHTPSRDWLKFVVTQRAKARVKQWLKTEERKQSLELGIKLIEQELRKHNLSPALLKSPKVEELAKDYNVLNGEELIAAVGFGRISAQQVVNRLLPEGVPRKEEEKEPLKRPAKGETEGRGVSIKGIDDVLYHTAKCCFPVPGDNLIGFITRGKGVAVHRRDCQSVQRIAVDEARVVDVDWRGDGNSTAAAKLFVDTVDKPGILANLSSVISSLNINISHIEATTYQDRKAARITLILMVKDRSQLYSIVQKIAQMEGVLAVKR